MNALAILKTLVLPVTIVLLTHSTGVFAIENLANGIKRRALQGITTRLCACVGKTPDSADAVGVCLSAEKVAQTRRLNRMYKTPLGTLDGKANDVLVSPEQAWQNFRTRTAAFEVAVYGKGKFDDLQRPGNEISRLNERADVFDKYLATEGH